MGNSSISILFSPRKLAPASFKALTTFSSSKSSYPSVRFSLIVPANNQLSWRTTPTFLNSSSLGIELASLPFIKTDPVSGSRRPLIVLSSDVFPAPDRPIIAIFSPLSTPRERFVKIGLLSADNFIDAFLISMTVFLFTRSRATFEKRSRLC